MIRLTISLRAGDHSAAAAAAAQAEILVSKVPGDMLAGTRKSGRTCFSVTELRIYGRAVSMRQPMSLIWR